MDLAYLFLIALFSGLIGGLVAGLRRARSTSMNGLHLKPLHQRVGECCEQQAKLVGREALAARTGSEEIELRFLEARVVAMSPPCHSLSLDERPARSQPRERSAMRVGRSRRQGGDAVNFP